MAAKKFGYVRVSTREQNPERQIHILRDEEGIDEPISMWRKNPGGSLNARCTVPWWTTSCVRAICWW